MDDVLPLYAKDSLLGQSRQIVLGFLDTQSDTSSKYCQYFPLFLLLFLSDAILTLETQGHQNSSWLNVGQRCSRMCNDKTCRHLQMECVLCLLWYDALQDEMKIHL